MPKVLVADDDRDLRGVIKFVLVSAGYQVTEARDGRAALEKARAEHPDLILLDLNMPRMVGRAVLVELKSDPKLKQIPVIVLSNSDAEDDIEHIYRHNGNCYVIKPEDMQGMSRFVESLQQFWGERVRFSPGLG